MFRQLLVAYILGAFTFWPLLACCIYFAFRYLGRTAHDEDPQSQPASTDTKRSKVKMYTMEHLSKLNSVDSVRSIDFESDIEASGWIRLSPAFISSLDPYEETDGSQPKQPPSSARKSLRKLMSNSSFFSSFKSANAKSSKSLKSTEDAAGAGGPAAGGASSTTTGGTAGGSGAAGTSGASSVNVEALKPKSVAKCPRYWAVIRGAQLQLYEDQTERKFMEVIVVPKFVVSLWPQNLQEYELFYRRYPITLISRFDSEGVVSLDLYPGIPPRDALYLYVSNPVEKEDLYFALIKASKVEVPSLTPITEGLSLGPRDPVTMAKPVGVKKAEAQQLQSSIWNNELPQDTQWLNALLGRIFLSIKDSRLAEAYLRRKFAVKLKPISDSSNIIGEIDVKKISSGSAAPYFSNIKLKELTPDGNLVLSARISYNGGFKVILGTSVKLAAVTSLTTKEIPVELAATLRGLEGSVIIRVKPAPSERIWYSFETMPEVDLHIAPAVYETHISLSVVTKFIRGKILDSLKETLVMPYMDDLTFYDTTDSFYRGGIWESTTREKAAEQPKKADDSKLQSAFAPGAPVSPSLMPRGSPGPSEASSLDSGLTPVGSLGSTGASGSGLAPVSSTISDTAGAGAADEPPPLAPRIRNRAGSTRGSMDSMESDTATQTARQRFSSWVRRRQQGGRDPSSPSSSVFEQDTNGLDSDSLMHRSPSVRGMAWTTATTQVTPTNASSERDSERELERDDEPGLSSSARTTDGPGSSPRRQIPRRKPVPEPAEPQPAESSPERAIPSSNSNNETSPKLSPRLRPELNRRPSSGLSSGLNAGLSSGLSPGLALGGAAPADPVVSTANPVPDNVSDARLGHLEFPNAPSAAVETTGADVKGELVEGPRRRSSVSSRHSRKTSDSRSFTDSRSLTDTRSIRSGNSISGPVLPPRNRRVVPLANIAPERDP